MNVFCVIYFLLIVGSGNGLFGFKIFLEFLGYIVGNFYLQKWMILLKLVDCWGDVVMFMISNEQDGFCVVVVCDEDIYIYKFEVDMWMKVGCIFCSV